MMMTMTTIISMCNNNNNNNDDDDDDDHYHHLSVNREGRWGTTDDFETSFLHFSLFSTALWDWRTPGLSIPWCCLPTSSPVCVVFFPLSLCQQDGFGQILLQIIVRTVIICSPPAWTSSAWMLSTPADFAFFRDCTAASTSLRRMGWSSSVYRMNILIVSLGT